MSVPLTPSADKNWITAHWACLEESMARLLTVILLLFQSTTHCRFWVYTKFLLTYTTIYRRNRKVLPLGITAPQPQSHFHLGTPYIWWICGFIFVILCRLYWRRCKWNIKDSLNDTHKWIRYSNTENLFISECTLVFSSVNEILGGMITVFWGVTFCIQVHISEKHAGTEVSCHCRCLNPPPLLVTMKELITIKHN